jgi:deglycosylation enzyme subunit DgpB
MGYVDVLAPRALRTAAGVELRLRSPLARAVPLSVVSLELAFDGAEIEPDRVRFCVNDRDYSLSELPALHDESWFVLDPARVRVRLDAPATSHDVEVRLSIRSPFIPREGAVPVRTVHRRQVEVVDERDLS